MLDGVFKLYLSDDLVERAAGAFPSLNGLEARSTRVRSCAQKHAFFRIETFFHFPR